VQPRKLRGDRYLDDKNPKSVALAKFITDELHFLDYEPTLRWYRETVPDLDQQQTALLGCNDRYFLLTSLLGRHSGDGSALHPWLFQRCREVEAAPDGYLDLWSRFHFKSSIGTHAGIIQEVMCNPEIRICILSATNKIAKPFLRQIQEEFEQNELLKATYPDVLWANPRKEAPLWSRAEGIVVKRSGKPKEATVEAYGLVDGMPTGKHFDLLNYDDLVTVELATNLDIIKKVSERYQLSDSLGVASHTMKWHWGTRYAYGDTYGWLLEERILKARIYPATDDGTKKGNPVYMTPARWKQVLKVQQRTLAAQMLLNPLADASQTFRPEWFRPYLVRPSVLNVYILCDPSKGSTQRSDRTAIAVIGLDPSGNMYLLDGYRHRMPLSERWQRLKELHKKWSGELGVQFVKVGYEIYGQQADAEVLKDYMEREKYHFSLTELNTPRQGGHSKADRIERLEPDMRDNRFFIPGVVHHPEFVAKPDTAALERVSVGEALWSVWSDDDAKKNPDTPHNVGQIVYHPLRGELKVHRALRQQDEMKNTGQQHRIVHAIKRRDEEGNLYDLTREFMAEAMFFPLAPKDDLIDAVSRIYDIEASPPKQFESTAFQPKSFPDS
jgi:hypothetical protein